MTLGRALGAVILLLSTAQQVNAHDHHSPSSEDIGRPSGNSIFNLKSKWTTQNGLIVGLDFLKGQPSVVAMAYTSCQSSCPLIVEQMKKIETEMSAKSKDNARFFFFSFDSKKDTPEQLRKFAIVHKLDLKKWVLLNGNAHAVRDLAEVFGIRYRQDSRGDFDHSNIITLVDADGVVRFQQTGVDQKPEVFAEKLTGLMK